MLNVNLRPFILLALVIIFWSDQTMAGVLALPQFKSSEERQKLEYQALQGSPDAAEKIVGILALFPSSDRLYWATIAAENSSYKGAYNLAVFLVDPGTDGVEPYEGYAKDREWYWLIKAANSGHELAIYTLKTDFPQSKKLHLEPDKEVKQWVLSNKTLPKYKRAAMRGSPEAAYRLCQHYSFSPASELKEGLFWATIAAQNSHPKAPYIVGKLLLKTGKPNDHERALFWLRKAATTGDKDAIKLLEMESPGEGKK